MLSRDKYKNDHKNEWNQLLFSGEISFCAIYDQI